MPVSRWRRPTGDGRDTWTQQVGPASPSAPRVARSFTTASSSPAFVEGAPLRTVRGAAGVALPATVFGDGCGDGTPPCVLGRDVQLQKAGGAGQPVQVGLELPGLAADGQHGFEDAVPAGGAQIGGHQLRL